MSAIILLEGCDKVGKSTEAQRLAEVLGDATVVHFGVPTGNPFEDYRAALIEADKRNGSTIIDRLHWSNEAYQTVYRGDGSGADLMSVEQVDELDGILNTIGGVVILKIRPFVEIAEAMDEEDYGSADPRSIVALQQIFEARYLGGLGKPGSPARTLVPFGEYTGRGFIALAEERRAEAVAELASGGD